MELVRAASLTGYFAVAGELQLNVMPLLRRAALSRTMMSDPEQMLPARSVVHLLEDSADATGHHLWPKNGRVRAALRPWAGQLAYRPPADSGDALDVLSEYRNRINSNLTLQVEHHDDAIFLREHFALQRPLYSRQVNDLALGVFYKLCRSVMSQQWRPQCVSFSYERPAPARTERSLSTLRLPHSIRADFDGIVVEKVRHATPQPNVGHGARLHARSSLEG